MTIHLHNAFMWFLTAGRFHLSEAAPGPIEIDFRALSKEEQKHLILSIRTGQISCSESIDNLTSIFFDKPVVSLNPVVLPKETQQFPEQELNKILGKSIGTVKKYIGLSEDIRKLRLMLELEKNNRSRNPIISALESKLSALATEIKNSIVQNNDINEPILNNIDRIASEMTITDSEEKIVKIMKQ